ncbi:MAG: radical SAM protein [Nannocystaceae bacterium]
MTRSESDVLVVFPTRYCNIECDHCIVDSGPRRRGTIDVAAASTAIEGAAMAGMSAVVFSGGESLVYEPALLSMCEHAHRLGLRTRVFTNGFWARSASRAQDQLERLARGHVDELVVSIDEYHAPWVPPDRVHHIVRAATHAAAVPFIFYQLVVPPRAMPDPEPGVWPPAVLQVLDAYGLAVERCVPFAAVDERCRRDPLGPAHALDALTREHMVLQWLPAFSGGRTRQRLPTLGTQRSLADAPGRGCAAVGRQITVTPEGNVYPCCSTWTNLAQRSLGRLTEVPRPADFADMVDEIRADPVVRAIHHHGPGRMLAVLAEEGHAIRGRYADICDRCEDLLSRFGRPQLEHAARELEGRTMLAWLTSDAPVDRSDA